MTMDERIDITNLTQEQEDMRISIYSLLGALLARSPDAALLAWLAELDADEYMKNRMSKAWGQVALAAKNTTEQDVAEEFQLVFIGVGRGEVLPYASWYLTGSLMEMPLALLRQDLRQLGYERQVETKEPEDNMAALLEVMAMMVQEQTQDQQATFFNRHITPWFVAFFEDLKQAESATFYNSVAELAITFLSIEHVRFSQQG